MQTIWTDRTEETLAPIHHSSRALRSCSYKDPGRTHEIADSTPDDVTQIACAVNTFGETGAFRISDTTESNASGLCLRAIAKNIPKGERPVTVHLATH